MNSHDNAPKPVAQSERAAPAAQCCCSVWLDPGKGLDERLSAVATEVAKATVAKYQGAKRDQ